MNSTDVAKNMKSIIMKRLTEDANNSKDKRLFADEQDELGAIEMLLNQATEITPEVEELADAYMKLSLD